MTRSCVNGCWYSNLSPFRDEKHDGKENSSNRFGVNIHPKAGLSFTDQGRHDAAESRPTTPRASPSHAGYAGFKNNLLLCIYVVSVFVVTYQQPIMLSTA